MGIIRQTAIVILLVGLLSPGLLAGGFETTGLGSSARGMAGAFRAIADDWTAAYYNPAGYAFVYDNQFGTTNGFTHFRHELTPNYRYTDDLGNLYETGVYNDRTLYNQHEVHSMPGAGVVARLPVWGETTFGLSAYQPFDNNLTWTVWEPLLAYNDSIYDYLPTDQIVNDLDVVAFQLTAARQFNEDKMAVGIGLQLLRADLLLKNIAFRENPMEGELSDRPYDKIPELVANDGSGWGFGLKAGMLWKLNEKTNLALTASLPLSITIEGDAELRYIMPRNEYSLSEGNPDRYYFGEVEYNFVRGLPIRLLGSFETELNLPASFGFGLAYAMSEKLTLALDAEYTMWSSFEGFEFTYTNLSGLAPELEDDAVTNEFFTADMSYPTEWDNTIKAALGARYLATDYLTLVGGVSYDQSPLRDAQEITPLFVDPGNKLGFSGGIIAAIDRWELGLITSYVSYSDDETVGALLDTDNDGVADNFPGTYSANTYETVFTVNYRF